MARRSDHTHEELKSLIFSKAWDIVGREGLIGLTARRVAADIGYTPGTIYNFYQSMDDLCLAINARTLDMLYGVLSSPICNNIKNTPAQNMKAMAAAYMQFSVEHNQHWLMLFTHRLPEGRSIDDVFRGKVDRLFEPLEILLKPLYAKGKEQERRMAARLLWSSVHGLCFLHQTGKIGLVSNDSALDMAAYLIDTFLAGLATRT